MFQIRRPDEPSPVLIHAPKEDATSKFGGPRFPLGSEINPLEKT
jgi:hypothetical protein